MRLLVIKAYRKGALGALMDEYGRACEELSQLIAQLTDAEYEVVRDRQTRDEDCRSIQTVVHTAGILRPGGSPRASARLSH